MLDTSPQAHLYLADQRGCSRTNDYRRYHTFNFGTYANEHRKPFGALQALNDDTLGAGQQLSQTVGQPTNVVLIPLFGGLAFSTPFTNGFVEAGQVQTISLPAGMSYAVMNPYETELINFIQLWLPNRTLLFSPASNQTVFDLTRTNVLHPAFSVDTAGKEGIRAGWGFIGHFDGRSGGAYSLIDPANGVFVFVINGAFEVQHRLLHARDGLALPDIRGASVDFEALSNQALILLMELPMP